MPIQPRTKRSMSPQISAAATAGSERNQGRTIPGRATDRPSSQRSETRPKIAPSSPGSTKSAAAADERQRPWQTKMPPPQWQTNDSSSKWLLVSEHTPTRRPLSRFCLQIALGKSPGKGALASMTAQQDKSQSWLRRQRSSHRNFQEIIFQTAPAETLCETCS